MSSARESRRRGLPINVLKRVEIFSNYDCDISGSDRNITMMYAVYADKNTNLSMRLQFCMKACTLTPSQASTKSTA